MGKHKKRPWIVALPMTELAPCEHVTLVVEAPRGTPSLRKLTLTPSSADIVIVRSIRIGSVDTGRELLDTGPVPANIFLPGEPETFDVPIERGQSISVVLENVSNMRAFTHGVFLGKGLPR